ncbi:MAG: CRISPR-associated endoribonuclease Cas6 [Saprospiraceae bacterium]|nr:CRISPR-associated endoribonuclease Cas6 [Saprospiraceae bacterium]MDW8484882.1 CRISPR-associated endoribonuclease Cas6 [Saprospiraceae bacterium]
MRIYLTLSKNTAPVPYDYPVNLVGALHKWVGQNTLHDFMSLYSFSWLQYSERGSPRGLNFPNGALWFISAYDPQLVKKIVGGILDDPEVAFGMRVLEITLRETPAFASGTRFSLGSPVLIKRTIENRQRHYLFTEPEADVLLTETLQRKLAKAGLPTEGISVRFDRKAPGAKTKVSTYRGVANRVNYCPVIIEGLPEQIGFAWEVGLGNSTGIGFGSLH